MANTMNKDYEHASEQRIRETYDMRTTYRGQNRAQALKAYRDTLAYQKHLIEKKEKELSMWRRLINWIKS